MQKIVTLYLVLFCCISHCSILVGQDLDCETFNPPESCLLSPRKCDSLELLKFYCAMNGENWDTTLFGTPWCTNNPIDTWGGVFLITDNVDLNQKRVLKLKFNNELASIGISGELPELNLPKLDEINLQNENIVGSLPTFDSLPDLKYLIIRSSNINSELPKLQNNLQIVQINFNSNEIDGTIPIEWNNLTQLNHLDLSGNMLEGGISNSFPNNKHNLQIFAIGGNKFQGTFPRFDLSLLTLLNISNNCFSNLDSILNTAIENTAACSSGFIVHDNNLNFSDILKNKGLLVTDCNNIINNPIRYSPQKCFGLEQNFIVEKCSDLIINLEIDEGVFNNEYQWMKIEGGDTIAVFLIIGENFLEVDNISEDDKGKYFCEVTNPEIPGLTLISKNIIISFDSNTSDCTCPNDNLSLETPEPLICWNTPATILLNNPQAQLTYKLLKNGTSTGNIITNTAQDTFFITNSITETTIFSIQVSDLTNGCEFDFDQSVTVSTTPSPYEGISILPEDDEICWNSKTNILVNNSQLDFSYVFTQTGEVQQGNGTPLSFQTSELTENSVFDIIIQYNDCSYTISDTANVKVRPDPQLDTSFIKANPPLICTNEHTEIIVNPSFSEFNYILLNNNGAFEAEKLGDANGLSLQFETLPIPTNTTYTVSVKDVNFPSCIYPFKDTLTIAVSNMSVSTPSIINPSNNRADGSIGFTVSSGFPSYTILLAPPEKSRSNSSVINGVQSFILSGLTNRQYTLEVQDSAGCFFQTGINIEREEENSSNIWISPKGKGFGNNANDFILFDATLLNVSVCPQNIIIKNQRGQTVFSDEDQDCSIRWEGTDNNNEPLENGTYYYVISFEGIAPKKGFITLTNDD